MSISESARQDLYSGLVEVLGPHRAEVLMAHLPSGADELATKSDLDAVGSRMNGLEARLSGVETRLSGVETRLSGVETRLSGVETRLGGVEAGLVGVNQRLDRLFLTLLAGMLGVLTALAGTFVAGTLL